MKILYIEDAPINVRVMQRIASYLGYELSIGVNAAEGLKLLHQNPDLILMDITLPDVDGLTLARQIREANESIPIVAVTANARDGDKERCLDAGCTEYVSKPFVFNALVDLLKRYESATR